MQTSQKQGEEKGRTTRKKKNMCLLNKGRQAHREGQKKERECKVVGSEQTDEENEDNAA